MATYESSKYIHVLHSLLLAENHIIYDGETSRRIWKGQISK